MRRSFERLVLRASGLALAAALAACGKGEAPASESAVAVPTSPVVAAAADAGEEIARAPAAASPALEGRTQELVNPEHSAMVFLYLDLSGLTPPYDNWVESDFRVTTARPIDKPATRQTVRAELEAGFAAVHKVGALRLTIDANLSEYDPSYSEFSVRALAPSSVVEFSDHQQKISIRFANGLTAQTWHVPEAESQLIRDKVGRFGNVSVDALLRITGVQPAPGGGTITVEVLDYELRSEVSGQVIGRVKVAS